MGAKNYLVSFKNRFNWPLFVLILTVNKNKSGPRTLHTGPTDSISFILIIVSI